ncbi:DUF2884 family protein [Vibrio sp. 05-20-BW147]|uniref:YggN family protein n=1 Tax=Vibrio sp. 05-20-BW147 TaxID=2575834 RepID=UPI0015934ADD|nr:YggN family protein [Vibrio sp. 05-20-BW147]NVC62066.1 DUF2884 family protein [Vibrio sp. 05-20-BW147]
MKKLAIFIPLFVATSAQASQCRVDIKNEVRLDGEVLEIHQTNGDKAVVDASNNLYIHGEKIELNDDQQAAIEEYRENLNAYLPRAKQVAEESLALANDIIDDIAVSLDAPDAFDNVKTAVKEFFADVESRYYKDGDLILPADSFASMTDSWSEDFKRAQDIFNKEFISSAFDAMSSKMKQEGGLNLSAMSESMTELKQKVQERLQQHSQEIEQQTQEFCDSLEDMAVQEQDLQQKIPELKNYPVFTI